MFEMFSLYLLDIFFAPFFPNLKSVWLLWPAFLCYSKLAGFLMVKKDNKEDIKKCFIIVSYRCPYRSKPTMV